MTYLNFLNSKKYSLSFNGIEREYLLHSPLSNSSQKMPLVIALHGYKDNPRLMEFYSGLSRKADKEKFVVIYPYGSKNEKDKNLSWNGGSCCGNGVLNNTEDVDFINNLTDEVIRNNNIDPKSIYLVGFSNGGLLAYRIASETPEKYRAVAVVSGSIGGKVYKALPEYKISKPVKPISMLIMHGILDKRIPFAGGLNAGKDGSFKSFRESADFWIKNNGCSAKSKFENEIYIQEVYENCSGGKKIEAYSVKKSGHAWPGSFVEIMKNLKGESISTTDVIWSFFKNSDKLGNVASKN